MFGWNARACIDIDSELDRGYDMRTTKAFGTVLASLLLLGLGVVGASAVEGPQDEDGYPVDVEEEDVVVDDVLVEDVAERAPVIQPEDEPDVAVLGVQLPVTGGQLLLLLAAGAGLAAAGLLLLTAARRRRGASVAGS
jgi:hypothetical protein